ncbi:MAG: hypothetical protein CTY12_08190 [Methylotenera sp.]|nr:MAG: hypothetical protein CTY12_08190 [Methylotenera sp.]
MKNFYLKFISGRLGLGVTFWIFGVLIALLLNFLNSRTSALWQIIVLTSVTFVHFVLIVIAVWNASKLYSGSQIWKWLARIIVILNVAKWLWYLPLLIATLMAGLGFPIHSSDFWELNWHKDICQPAEYLITPEKLVKRYQCSTSISKSGELVFVQCQDRGIARDYIFAKSEHDCEKNLTKLKDLRKGKK